MNPNGSWYPPGLSAQFDGKQIWYTCCLPHYEPGLYRVADLSARKARRELCRLIRAAGPRFTVTGVTIGGVKLGGVKSIKVGGTQQVKMTGESRRLDAQLERLRRSVEAAKPEEADDGDGPDS